MEVGRKQIPLEYVEKIKGIYNLTEEQEVELENSIYETNERVPIELAAMNEAQKDVSLMFARKIKTADEDLLRKLKEALLDEKTNPLKIVEIENYANNLRKELGIPSNSFFQF